MARSAMRFLWLVCGFCLLPVAARAQGVLVNINVNEQVRLPRPIIVPSPTPIQEPQPPSSYKIKELDVQVRLKDQVARVQVSQSFVNTGSAVMEVCFMFPLPYDGAIDQLTLLIDGKEHPARLLERGEARRVYESIVRKNRDPALLEWMGTGMFQTSVFPVPPGAERKVSLRYSQLCKKNHGLTDFVFPLSTSRYTSQPLERLALTVNIESQTEIKNVYSPTHSIAVQREGGHATVKYEATNQVPTSDFRLFYDVESGKLGTSVISYKPRADEEGYFLVLTSPQIQKKDGPRPAKTILFVLDRSGSMSGEKIEQAKGALKFVLNNLREGDLFNIVAYDSSVESFRPELERFTDASRQSALAFVEGIYAGGSTNIDGALAAAMAQLKDSQRPSYVLFLTDGLPTAGETNESRIVANAKSANRVRARVVAFGVGYDLNSRLLDKLARANFGQSEYVRPNENIEDRVSRLYNRIESPVMTDLALAFSLDAPAGEGSPVSRVYPKDSFDLFEGEQLVLVGRYKQPGTAKVTVTGRVQDAVQSYDFPAEFTAQSTDDSFAFVEKLWASRRIGELIDDLDLNGKNDELIKELVALSTRHGILTPYTSFLADENVSLHDVAVNFREAETRLGALAESDGESGVSQRAAKESLRKADSFFAPVGGAPAEPGVASGQGGQVQQGYVRYRLADRDEEQVVATCRTLGNKAFYCRDNRWIDSTITEEMEKNARRIEQFSDEYFELADKHGRKLSQYLVYDEPLLVNLEGEAFFIDPAAME